MYGEQDPLDDEFARCVLRQEKLSLFHFYYMPDSYDSWTPNPDLDYDPPESPPEPPAQWKVRPKELFSIGF